MSDHKEIVPLDRGFKYSDEWRRICLARYLLDEMDLYQRRAFISEIRNKDAVAVIKQDLITEVKRRKECA